MIHILLIPISIALFYSLASPVFSMRMILILNVILFMIVWAIYYFEIICKIKTRVCGKPTSSKPIERKNAHQ